MRNPSPARRGTHDLYDEAAVRDVVRRATEGDAGAAESLVRHVQDDVHNLAVRMLWCPDDAADATQEILLKVVTRLAAFRGESAFRTWVYRIAVNHLLDVRRSRVEREGLTFARFGASLAEGLTEPAAGWESDPEQRVLVEEVKIGCTTGMLLCLDRAHRVAYVLGDVFELTGEEAGEVLGVTPAAFRQRLARARARLRAFMAAHCGLVSESAACRCERRVRAAVDGGRVRPERLLFAHGAADAAPHSRRQLPVREQVGEQVLEMDRLHRMAGVFRSHPRYRAPERVLQQVRRVLTSGRFSVLE